MPALKVETQKIGSYLILHFFGALNEDAKIPPQNFKDVSEIQVNLEKMTQINSVGIRSWIQFINTIPISAKVILNHVPRILILQANAVAGFFPKNSEIASYEVPYFCEYCNKTFSSFSSEKDSDKVAETTKCPKCKTDSELDVIKPNYFKFLDRT